MFQKIRDRIADYLAESARGTPFELPLFPLKTVLFPGGVLTLRVFEPRYMEMTKRCLTTAAPFGVCLIREGAEVGTPAVPHGIGTTARISDWDMQELGVLNIRAVGDSRFQILDTRVEPSGLIVASARLLPIEAPTPLPPEHAACASVLRRIIAQVGEDRFEPPFRFDDAVWVGHRLAEALPLKLSAKQNMLEMNDSLMRLEILHRFLAQQGLAT